MYFIKTLCNTKKSQVKKQSNIRPQSAFYTLRDFNYVVVVSFVKKTNSLPFHLPFKWPYFDLHASYQNYINRNLLKSRSLYLKLSVCEYVEIAL